MAAASLSDIPKAVILAWEVYQLGWSTELNATRQYNELGNDIKGLAENLNNIVRVVENARITWQQQAIRSPQFRGVPTQKDWDLTSLHEIVGDYNATLADCKRLLEENPEFRKKRNFAYNIEWNLVIQPKADLLRKRFESHNSKILILLKPLELNLLSDIHQDLANRIDVVHQSILRLQGLLIQDVEQALLEQRHTIQNPLTVPPHVESKFQAAAEKSRPGVTMPGKFPLQAGADIFVTYFAESTKHFTAGNFLNERTPSPKQYINLLKCIWIMAHLQKSSGLTDLPQSSQWPGYIDQLNDDLCYESQRFMAPSAQRLIVPELSSSISLDEYNIWQEEDIAQFMSPQVDPFMEQVLKLPMPSQRESLHREMTVYRINSTKYRLVESVEDKESSSSRQGERLLDVDLKSIQLTPIYATPSSRPKALEVILHSGTTQIRPTFKELKHVLRLQHLLTGYKVYERYDQAMVRVSFFVSGQIAPMEEHGRIQLWLPQPFTCLPANASPNTSEESGPATPTGSGAGPGISSMGPSTGGMKPTRTRNRASIASTVGGNNIRGLNMPASPASPTSPPVSPPGGSARFSFPVIAPNRKSNPNSTSVGSKSYTKTQVAPSVMSNSSSYSRSSVSTVTTIKMGRTGTARLHSKPTKPLLVIFLKSQDASAKLALVAIQIDDMTAVKRERCDCSSSHSKCRISCVERANGFLLAQRWDADDSLGSWNLVKLGMDQRRDGDNLYSNVKRVSMKFDKMEDRYKFSGSPCSCKPKTLHELSRCNLESHNGIFGIVKQIGSQALRNYHQEREQASTRNIVIQTLPENES